MLYPHLMHQLDYLSFIIGFSFLVIAVIFFYLAHDRRGRLAWRWACAFGILQGCFWLLSLLALSLPDTLSFQVVRLGLFTISYLCLLEFARLSFRVQSGHAPTPLVHLILAVGVICGTLFGFEVLDVFLRLGVVLPGGFFAACVLLKESGSQTKRPVGFRLGLSGICLAAYSLLIVVGGPEPGISPLSLFLGRESAGALVFFIYLIMAAASVTLASTLTSFTSTMGRDGENFSGRLSDIQWFTWLLALVLVSGWGFTEWIGEREDSSMRKEVLTQARIASLAIDVSKVRALKGGPEDLGSPEYLHIKKQLTNIRKAEPLYRFIYLMGRKGRAIFFHVDSEDPESEDYSPPGQIYEQDTTDYFLQAFDPGIEITEGPLSDEWGTWMSASIPVRDPGSGTVLCVLGVDVDASDWMKKIYHARMMSILATMITTLLALSFTIYQRRSRISNLRIKASEQTLRYALDATSEGIWDWNLAAGKIKYSPLWIAMMGYSPEEVLLMEDFRTSIIHPDDAAKFRQHVEACLQGIMPVYHCEIRMRTREGGYRYILDRGKVVKRDRQGAPVRMVGTFSDITSRRDMEDDLRRKEEQYRHLVDNANDVIYETDASGVIRYVNPAGKKLTGYAADELIGKSYLHFVRQDYHRELVRTTGIQFVKKIPSIYFECPITTKDGLEVWIGQNVRLLLEGGAVTGFHAVARDITERKKAEDALKESEERANRMAGEASAANQAKSRFLANMSHEIRTPMNGVIGMCELLMSTELTPAQLQYVEIILKSGEALITLINDILDFSKIEADRLDLEMIDFDLRSMLEDLTDLLAVRAAEKGIEISCLIEPHVSTLLRGDPGRLRQVIVNLAGNAVKFTSEGEVSIAVKQIAETAESVSLQFSIRDTGIGIPPDKIPLLFSPFTQVDSSSTRKFGGTGLGLAISKKLTEMMGGMISVESIEGKGSTFSFTLHFGKQPSEAIPVPQRIEGIAGVHILIIDDNATNRRVLSLMLESWGVRHEQAAGADEALRMLKEAARRGDPFTVALLDSVMEDMGGVALGRAIKEETGPAGTILVMLSSLARRGEASRVKDAGFAAYLTKPVRQAHLFECLGTVLGLHRDGSEQAGTKNLVTRHTLNEAKARRPRILLVEDNLTNKMVAEGMLKNLGCRATAVESGAAAIRALQKTAFDLVLMDCQMPDMDGFETTAVIRDPESRVLNHRIPVIAMTAYVMKGDRERCMAAGMDDYLAKPIRQAHLAAMLEKRLSRVSDAVPLLCSKNRGPHCSGAVPPEQGQPQEASEAVFDPDELMERLDGDKELAGTVLDAFFESIPETLARLSDSLDTGDAAGIGLHAHSLKGAAANAGGAALSGIAREMEMAGKAEDFKSAASLMPRLLSQFDLFRSAAERTGWVHPKGNGQ